MYIISISVWMRWRCSYSVRRLKPNGRLYWKCTIFSFHWHIFGLWIIHYPNMQSQANAIDPSLPRSHFFVRFCHRNHQMRRRRKLTKCWFALFTLVLLLRLRLLLFKVLGNLQKWLILFAKLEPLLSELSKYIQICIYPEHKWNRWRFDC